GRASELRSAGQRRASMSSTRQSEGYAEKSVQKAALIVGIVFLLVGIAGFIPGLTHSAEHLHGAVPDSEAYLVRIFQVSVLHNALRLGFAVAGFLVAMRAVASRAYLIWGGLIYLALWVYGLFAAGHDDVNFIPLNEAD